MTTTRDTTPRIVARSQLVEALRIAKASAEMAGQNTEDGGSCNLDSPALRLKGWPEALVKAAGEEAGVRLAPFHWFGNVLWYWVCLDFHGQGNRRARMSQAAVDVLHRCLDAHDWVKVAHYMQMD